MNSLSLQVFSPTLFLLDTRGPCWQRWSTSPFAEDFQISMNAHNSGSHPPSERRRVYRGEQTELIPTPLCNSTTCRSNYGTLSQSAGALTPDCSLGQINSSLYTLHIKVCHLSQRHSGKIMGVSAAAG